MILKVLPLTLFKLQLTVPVHPVAVKTAGLPEQIATSATAIVGVGLTITVPVAVALQLPKLQVAV